MKLSVFQLSVRMLLLVLLPLIHSQPVSAHDARPVTVTITELLPGLFRARLLAPPVVDADNQPELLWPTACSAQSSGTEEPGGSRMMNCPDGLAGEVLVLDYPRFNPSLSGYFTLRLLDGTEFSGMLRPDQSAWQVPEQAEGSEVAGSYFLLGIEHIIGGSDHLLFVFGLLVIARTTRRVLFAVTGFTAAHSITLSLAALDVISLPTEPVEAVIALSIVYLAYEISRHNNDSLSYRMPYLVAFSFGLLHGLGFASVLGEIGLADQHLVLSLLFFNLGVEAGQIAFILAVVLAVTAAHKMIKTRCRPQSLLRLATSAELAAAYMIGIPSAYWLLERVGLFA